MTRAWEAAAHEVEATGVRLVIVRTGQVLDPGGGLLGELLTPFKLGLGGPIAGGGMYLSWIHRDDEVGILLWALDTETASGIVNASAPHPVTNKEFSKALGRALGRPAIAPVPGFALDLKFGKEFGEVLRGGQRVIPKRTQELGYEFKHARIDEALRTCSSAGGPGPYCDSRVLRTSSRREPELVSAASTAARMLLIACSPELALT